MPTAAVTFQQQSIDFQITLLKRQKNALTPVGHIPPEILSEILLLATLDAGPAYDFFQRTQCCVRTLCHVSHSWRTIALGCPGLWTAIDVSPRTKARKIRFFVANTRNLPISLCINLDVVSQFTSAHDTVRPKALKTVTRLITGTELSRLTYRGNIYSLAELLPAFPQGRSLQAVRLNLGTPPDHWRSEGAILSHHILFQDGFPGLRILSLTGCTFPLTSPVLLRSPQLTDLSLAVPKGNNLQAVVSILRGLLLLQQLCLRMPHPLTTTTALDDQAPVPVANMPNLASLTLFGGHVPIMKVLPQLKLSAAHLILTLGCSTNLTGEDFQRVGAHIFAAIGQARSISTDAGPHLESNSEQFFPQKLILGIPDIRSGIRVGSYDPVFMEHPSPAGTPEPFRTTTVIFQASDHNTNHALDCNEWIPLTIAPAMNDYDGLSTSNWSAAELKSIVAVGDVNYPDAFWRRLSTYPKLNQVCMGSKDVLNFLPYLFSERGNSPDNDDDSDDDDSSDDEDSLEDVLDSEDRESPTFPFPALHHIQVHRSTSPSTSFGFGATNNRCDALLEPILNALRLRRALAQKLPAPGIDTLQSLTFLECESAPNRTLVSAISSLVHQLVWKRRAPQPIRIPAPAPAPMAPQTRQVSAHIYYNSDDEDDI